jgi:hypothetical protein
MLSLQLPQNSAHLLLMNSLMAKKLQVFLDARKNKHLKFVKGKLTKEKKWKKKQKKNWL